MFLNMTVLQGGVVSPSPTPKLEGHPLSAVHDCLFSLFAATLHIGGRSSIRNLRTRHAVVTGTHYMASLNIPWLNKQTDTGNSIEGLQLNNGSVKRQHGPARTPILIGSWVGSRASLDVWRREKSLPPWRFEPQIGEYVAQLIYWLRYPDS